MGTDPFRLAVELTKGIDGVEQVERVRRGLWILATTPRPPVGLTPHEVIHQHDKLVVRYYPPARDAGLPPVVLVPSMINRAWILDLEPGRSMVQALSSAGHATYLVDWGIPGPEDANEDVGYTLLTLLHRAVERVCRHARHPRAFMLGYCMGGTLAAIYAALRPQRVAGLVMLNAPVKFSEGGRFRDFVDPANFDVDRAINADGLVPVEVMKPAFQLLAPMGNWYKLLALELASYDPKKLYRTLVRERWLEENVPMPGAFAREFIREAYQQDGLMSGQWHIQGERVDLSAITCPLLAIASEQDFIAPPASVLPLLDLVSSQQKESVVLPSGHIAAVVASMGPRVLYPLLDTWFRKVA